MDCMARHTQPHPGTWAVLTCMAYGRAEPGNIAPDRTIGCTLMHYCYFQVYHGGKSQYLAVMQPDHEWLRAVTQAYCYVASQGAGNTRVRKYPEHVTGTLYCIMYTGYIHRLLEP